MPDNISAPPSVKLTPRLACMPVEILENILVLTIPEQVTITLKHRRSMAYQTYGMKWYDLPIWQFQNWPNWVTSYWIKDLSAWKCTDSSLLLVSRRIRQTALKIFFQHVEFEYFTRGKAQTLEFGDDMVKTEIREHLEKMFAGENV
ncbi:uncharacterized protein AB675_11683 [Cyphellophora attinorum]|uniref:Uncharacterized protein n=1 Tax=Cyphellophora attinorum TaxID=1664694 RepID=A0A0N1H2H6_9EURO|nr:uncharacterized protein AB675_11683 [Phialophora attinorum]KPI35437.1 hypothetical protein AB675_11683 [Phialophora attinorum]